jgi:CheY-like chemotaxis protein
MASNLPINRSTILPLARKLMRISTRGSWHGLCKPCQFMNVEAPAAAILVRSPYRSWRILVVDDDENARYLDCMMLSRDGYTVDTAADGEEAWKMLLSSPYDLLLSDHNMPRLCGLDLVARMRAAGMTLPIIINSGCVGLEPSNHPGLDLAAVLHKPFEFTEVLDAVKRIVPLPPDREEATLHNGGSARSNLVPARFVKLVPAPVQPSGLTT